MSRFSQDVSKDWMDLPRYSKEYIDGVQCFLDFAFTVGDPQGAEIQCPCAKCCNINWYRRHVVYDHLICYGFVEGYTRWINHGEWIILMDDDNATNHEVDTDRLLNGTFKDVAHAKGNNEGSNDNGKRFYNLVDKRATKENEEDTTKYETSVATLRSNKGKQVDFERQAVISKPRNHKKARKTEDVAFQAMSRNKLSSQVRSYGRSSTASYIKKDEEIDARLVSLKRDIKELNEKIEGLQHIVRVLVQQNYPELLSIEEVAALLWSSPSSPPYASSAGSVA